MGTIEWGDNERRICSLCGEPFIGMGNNPEPLKNDQERCCDDCNNTKVISARLGYEVDLRHLGHHQPE